METEREIVVVLMRLYDVAHLLCIKRGVRVKIIGFVFVGVILTETLEVVGSELRTNVAGLNEKLVSAVRQEYEFHLPLPEDEGVSGVLSKRIPHGQLE